MFQLRTLTTFMLLLCLVANGWTAEANREDEDIGTSQKAEQPPKAKDPQNDAGKQSTSSKKKSKAGDDVFIPSEEISEDFAVSFPVDI